jgi:hypothetical protein
MIHRTTIIILLDTTTISIIRFLSVLSTKPNITLLTSQLLDGCEGISISRSLMDVVLRHKRTELGPLASTVTRRPKI